MGLGEVEPELGRAVQPATELDQVGLQSGGVGSEHGTIVGGAGRSVQCESAAP